MASYYLHVLQRAYARRRTREYDANFIEITLFTAVSLYAGFFAALIWNDITDADIDSVAHPDRPIPSGRISTKKFFAIAVFFSLRTAGTAYLISPWCLALTVAAALYVHRSQCRSEADRSDSGVFGNLNANSMGRRRPLRLCGGLEQAADRLRPVHYSARFGSLSTSTGEFWNMVLVAVFIYFTDACQISRGIADADGDRSAE
jgi:hypothetical protein